MKKRFIGRKYKEPSSETIKTAEINSIVILPYEKCEEFFVEDLGDLPRKPVYKCIKRIIDIVVSVFALIVLVGPMLMIGIAVKVNSHGPVLYQQERVGLNGKRFQILKFRTMYNDAEKDGAQWSRGAEDPRITPVGRFLRKTRLDELPQFLCILTGVMSLVGPRPEREVFYNEFETYIHGFSQRLKVKPGLTGLAQVNGGYDLKPEEKIMLDIEYIKKRSVVLDAKCVLKTVRLVFTHEGAK